MTTRTIFSAVLFTAILFVFSACGNDKPPPPPPTTVTLNKILLELFVGETETLIATITPENAEQTLSWTSSDNSIVYVGGLTVHGHIVAISPGVATITATTADGARAISAVMVVENPGFGAPTLTTDPGVKIAGTVWATRNVGAFRTFAAAPEIAGMLFQWNRPAAWSASGDVSGWDNTTPIGRIWERANDPCPVGWRVPTYWELYSLSRVDGGCFTYNGVFGRLFVDVTPYPQNQIFLPAAGLRFTSGAFGYVGAFGYYWSDRDAGEGEQDGNANAWGLQFDSTGNMHGGSYNRAFGFSIRCVAR